MKKIFPILLLILLVSSLFSCSDKEPLPEIVLGQDSYAFPSMAATISLFVTTNYEWTASCAAPWVTLSSSNGPAGKTTSAIGIAANETTDSRSTGVVIRCKDISREISITQQQLDAIIVDGDKELQFQADGGTAEIVLSSNVDCEVQMPAWVSLVESKALSSHVYSFAISRNEDYMRSGEILFKSSSASDTVRIVQYSRYSLLTITHQATAFTIPVLTGQSLLGHIDWGDGSTVPYAMSLAHSYSTKRQYVVRIEVADTDIVTFPTLADVEAVDFSRF